MNEWEPVEGIHFMPIDTVRVADHRPARHPVFSDLRLSRRKKGEDAPPYEPLPVCEIRQERGFGLIPGEMVWVWSYGCCEHGISVTGPIEGLRPPAIE